MALPSTVEKACTSSAREEEEAGRATMSSSVQYMLFLLRGGIFFFAVYIIYRKLGRRHLLHARLICNQVLQQLWLLSSRWW